MTQDEIIEMARRARLHRNQHNLASNPVQYKFSYDGTEEALIAFAKLVHQRGFMDGYTSCDKDNQNMLSCRIDDAVEEEREACAMLAQKTVCDTHIPTGVKIYGTAVAKAIRARGEA